MPSWSSTVSHAIPTDGQTDRKPGEAVDCGGRGDQRVHGQNGVKILVPSYRDSNETPFLC